MQFLTRVLIVLAVLGGLGYGSYAFGKYVLSARLFGPQKGAQTTTTASVGSDPLQTPSNADVEIVPAPQPARDSDDNETPVVVKPSATPNERVDVVPSRDDDNGSARQGTRNRPDPTRKPRRRRRARPTPRPEPRREPRPQVAPQAETPPTRTENTDPPAREDSNNDTPSVDTPRRSDPVPVPTHRRRERRTDVAPSPNVETPREEAPRIRPERERRRESSPVPVPEGALGGGASSPVPVPG